MGVEGKSEVLWRGRIRCNFGTCLGLKELWRELIMQEHGDMLGSRKGEVS